MAKRLALALLAAVVLLGGPARAALISLSFEDGRILEAEDPDRLWYPASLTKLMTAYLVFEALALGHLQWDQELTVSADGGSQPETSLGLHQGDTITVGQAVEAMVLRSANDAAVTLAEAVAGSEDRFAQQMTATARRIGMTQSTFVNANGLPDDRQVTTARDMAILARALLVDLPQRYGVFSLRGLTYGKDWLGNINGILYSLSGADGLKTGFTCKSGYNLVVSAARDGQRVIAVILGERSPEERTDRATEAVEHAFDSLKGLEEDLAPSRMAQFGAPLTPVDPGSLEGGPEPPPVVLSPGDCIYGAAPRLARGPWMIHVGNFRTYGLASRKMRQLRQMSGALGFSQQRIAEAKGMGANRFQARFANLSKADAQAACKALRAKGQFCRVVAPGGR